MKPCIFCEYSEEDLMRFGRVLSVEDVTVHHYCLLFAPGLCQRGEDTDGIEGFLLEDIKQEAARVKRLTCYHCLKKHANLGCSLSKCPRAFHTDCAWVRKCSFEFVDPFPTYCGQHVMFKQKERPKTTDNCGICLEKIRTKKKTVKSILIPCCKNSWYHHSCLQHFATSAGVYFKCPLCNDTSRCEEILPKLGIFLPEKDADWEFEGDAYINETRDKICDFENCTTFHQIYKDFPWLWKICSCCGGSAIHKTCIKDKSRTEDFVCASCTEILSKKRDEVIPVLYNLETPANDVKTPKTPNATVTSRAAEMISPSTSSFKSKVLSRIENLPSLDMKCQELGQEEYAKSSGSIKKENRNKSLDTKFTPWFSDDEQISSDNETESIVFTKKNNRKRKILSPPSSPETFHTPSSTKRRETRSKYKRIKIDDSLSS